MKKTITLALLLMSQVVFGDNHHTRHFIGERYGGGIVFYVYDHGRHGLISATEDQAKEANWYYGLKEIFVKADGLGAGRTNSTIIIASQVLQPGYGNYDIAAMVCYRYKPTTRGVEYGNWYLPSKWEMGKLMKQRNRIGGFDENTKYWTSNEFCQSHAYSYNLTEPHGLYGNPKETSFFHVRCIRKF